MSFLGKRKRESRTMKSNKAVCLIEDLDKVETLHRVSDSSNSGISDLLGASSTEGNPDGASTDPTSIEADESDSELSSSSEEPSSVSSGSESEELDENIAESDCGSDVINLRIGGKPTMRLRPAHTAPGFDLLAKVRNFMPQIHAANETLDQERVEGAIDKRKLEIDSDEGSEPGDGDSERGPVIEMNLGLGVLEEQKHGADGILLPTPHSSDSDEGSDAEGAMAAGSAGPDIFAALLGQQSRQGKPKPAIAEL